MKRFRSGFLQVLIFLLLAGNLEFFCQQRLRVDTAASGGPTADFDARRGHRMRPAPGLTVNSDGIRNPEVSSPRPSDEFRILCLGGSVAFGWGLSEAETFERVMEKEMQAAAPAWMRINVINAGTPGFDSRNFAALLVDLGQRYQPNVVIVVAGYNEPHVPAIDIVDLRRQEGRWKDVMIDGMRSLLRRSATYRYLTVLLLDTPNRESKQDATWIERSAGNLQIIADHAVAHGARCLVVFEARREQTWIDGRPDPSIRDGRDASSMAALKESYRKVAERGPAMTYLDMDEVFQKSGLAQDDLFQADDPVHPTARGAATMAGALVDTLRKRAWVP